MLLVVAQILHDLIFQGFESFIFGHGRCTLTFSNFRLINIGGDDICSGRNRCVILYGIFFTYFGQVVVLIIEVKKCIPIFHLLRIMHLQKPFHFLLLFLLPLLNHNIRHVRVRVTLSLNCVKRIYDFGGVHDSVDAEAIFQPLLQQVHLTPRLLSQQV